MHSFNQYLTEQNELNNLTFEQYCDLLDSSLNEGILDSIKDLSGGIKKTFKELSSELTTWGKDFGIEFVDLLKGFKNKNVFAILKHFGFSIKKILSSFNNLTKLWSKGLKEAFVYLSDTKVIKGLRSGVIKVDEILEKFPVLKKLTGPLIAALLLYFWLSLSFVGDLEFDFNISDILSALAGNFSLENLFTSPEGLMMLGLVGTGSFISAPWLGAKAANLALALLYTGLKHNKANPQILNKIRNKLNI